MKKKVEVHRAQVQRRSGKGAGCSSYPPVFGVFGISLDIINAPRSPAVKSLGRGELHG